MPTYLSPYFAFSAEKRRTLPAKLSFQEKGRRLGEMWSKLSDQQKEEYRNKVERKPNCKRCGECCERCCGQNGSSIDALAEKLNVAEDTVRELKRDLKTLKKRRREQDASSPKKKAKTSAKKTQNPQQPEKTSAKKAPDAQKPKSPNVYIRFCNAVRKSRDWQNLHGDKPAMQQGKILGDLYKQAKEGYRMSADNIRLPDPSTV